MLEKNRQLHFILVDDNEIDLFLHERLIRLQGISTDVVSFLNVSQALSHLEAFQDDLYNYPETVILLDLQMPEMDGFDFLDQFGKMPEEMLIKTKILIISSSLDFGDLSRSHAHHMIEKSLKKPLNAEDLKMALDEIIFYT